jgi:rhodanese-related sulfurtransferase
MEAIMYARLTLFLALAAWASTARASEPFQPATMEQVESWIAAKDAVVYDVNHEEDYAKNHLPGARFVSGKAWTKTLPGAKDARLVFYCSNPR